MTFTLGKFVVKLDKLTRKVQMNINLPVTCLKCTESFKYTDEGNEFSNMCGKSKKTSFDCSKFLTNCISLFRFELNFPLTKSFRVVGFL